MLDGLETDEFRIKDGLQVVVHRRRKAPGDLYTLPHGMFGTV